MPTVAAHLTALVGAAVERIAPGSSVGPCVPTRDAAHGDYQSNVAFRLAKALGSSPRAVADELAAAVREDPAVDRVEVAGAGFLNFRISSTWLAEHVRTSAPTPRPPVARTIVIDYSSPNIAKRMHVGHLRSTLIGNALDRTYRWLGWTVIADNHVGDWGTPFGKLIVAWQEWRDDTAYGADPIGELQRLYQLADERMKDDDGGLLERARAATVRLQQHDPDALALWKRFVEASMAEFDALYRRLGIRFDVVLGESAYDYGLQSMVDELLAKGVAVESEGAVIVPFDDPGLADHPLLVRKADGAALYGTSDLVCIRFRLERWAPERIVYVVDTRQQLHFRQAFAAARKAGMDATFVHVWFGMLKFPGGAVASTRKGQTLNLADVLDTAAAKAFDVVTAKSPDLPEEERRTIAEAVGVGAIKYFDLSQNPQSDITFDWDRALSLDGGSAVYLQYAYARLHSILRNGGAVESPPDVPVAVEHPTERALAVLVARTPEAIEAAAEAYRPNLLAEHLEALAKAVGPFYDACPVLREGVAPKTRAARLALVHAVAEALRVGMDLLGIRAIPRL